MNYSSHSSNFNSGSQQPPQQQTMHSYNNGAYYQNMMPPFAGFQYYGNNFQYPTVNFQQQQSCNYSQNFYPVASKTSETPFQGPKREVKPLAVFDPQRNEEIDLVEVSKATKSNSLLDEVKHDSSIAKISVSMQNAFISNSHFNKLMDEKEQDVLSQDENEDTADRESEQEDNSHYGDPDISHQDDPDISNVDDQNITDEDDDCYSGQYYHDEKENQNKSIIFTPTEQSQTIKYSQSIPKNMESISNLCDHLRYSEVSSSVTNLHEKYASDIIEKESETEEGRKIYDRNTLLKISKSPLCRKPDFDCNEIMETQSMKNYNMVYRRKIPNTLIHSENSYKSPHFRPKEQCSQDQNLENLRRNFKGILNKIVPQNFDLCVSDIKKLIIDTDWTTVSVENGMDCLIEEIFNKAVQEEAYSVTYANLCTRIVFYEEKDKTGWSFKKLLINRCKDMFEKPLQDQLTDVRNFWEEKINKEKDEKLKNLYKADIEEQVRKAKDKYFGNIRFIGELYLHDLLLATIINLCVTALMSKGNDEDALLSLCKLLETVGKKFDTKHKDKMNEYIKSITDISQTDVLDTRVRFRLFDIIEMSERDWQLRQIQVQKMIQPKTLDQVKKDDLDEKNIKASKLSNKSQIRMTKKNNNPTDIKLKPQQSKMQSLEINSLQVQPNNNIQLKPPCGLWNKGSGTKDDAEWKNVENKKNVKYGKHNSKYSHQNNKSSPIASRDESPSKIELIGRFALLQQEDLDNSMDKKDTNLLNIEQTSDYNKQCITDVTSSSSTREQSPINLEYNNRINLNSEDIFKKLLDCGHLDIESWCELADVTQTVANWIDWIMEKNKQTRNMVGDELAKLVTDGKLSMVDLVEGLKQFSEEIDDLKTDIPLIWNFLAEFLERFIVDTKSDINFFKVIFDLSESKNDTANCIAMCLKNADERLGHNVIKSIIKTSSWSFKDLVNNEHDFLKSKGLDFFISIDPEYFNQFRNDLMSLLPNDEEDVNQFLSEKIGLEMTQTEECVYFVARCVFEYLSNLTATDIIKFLGDRKLFFVRLLDRRSQFEKQTLDALNDSFSLYKETGLTAVINGLSDNILSYDAFQQFIQRDDQIGQSNNTQITLANNDGRLASYVYKSMFDHSTR